MLKIYTASRFTKGNIWLQILKDKDFKHVFNARWLRHFEIGTKETPERAQVFWVENLEDIADADMVLYFAEEDDLMGGALIEVGAALAYGKPVMVVGSNRSHRSWVYHPLIRQCDSLDEAMEIINGEDGED